jgi:hypothetical protein
VPTRRTALDEIIGSTLPPGASRLKHDLPHRIEVEFGPPAMHLVGQPEPVARA